MTRAVAESGAMKVTRLGHAALQIDTDDARLVFDPGVYSDAWREVADTDAVLVTHEHHDHIDVPNLPQLLADNPGARLYAPAAVGAQLEGIAVQAVESGMTLEFGGTRVEVVGVEHAVVHPRIPRVANHGFVVRVGEGPSLFHPGDAFDCFPVDVDILALPVHAPWASLAMSFDFFAASTAPLAFPIHDSGLSTTGRATTMRILGGLIPDDRELRDVDALGTLDL